MILLLSLLMSQQDAPSTSPILRLQHEGQVHSISFSADDKTLVSCGSNTAPRIWEVATGRELFRLKGHNTDSVNYVTFSSDGKVIASAGGDGTVRIWEAATGIEILKISEGGNVFTTAFSPDGASLATASFTLGTILLRDAITGKEVRKLEGHSQNAYALSFSPDGGTLASGSWDDTIILWDWATGRKRLTLQGHEGRSRSVAFSPNGKILASGGLDHSVILWDVGSGRELAQLKGHDHWVPCAAFSPDGRIVASGSMDEINLWEVASGKRLVKFIGNLGAVFSVAFSRDGKKLAGGTGRGEALVWKIIADKAEPTERSTRDLENLWISISGDDPAQAHAAMGELVTGGPAAAAFLRERLLAPPSDPERTQRLIANLDDDDVSIREKAARALEDRMLDPALWRTLESHTSSETRARLRELADAQRRPILTSAEMLRRYRAIWVLERMEALEPLETLSKGPIQARQTMEANAAAARLRRVIERK